MTALLLFLATVVEGATVIELENRKAGTTDWKITSTARSQEIEGYASAVSVNRGEQIGIFVNTPEKSYTIEIFRTGWYGGLGARRMSNPVRRAGVKQPMPAPDPVTGLIECRWTDPFVLKIPNHPDATEWASGVYLAKLTAGASGKQAYVIFVVRDDTRPSDLLFQSSVTTFQAYNNWGGKSLYAHNSKGPEARKVSFNRPYDLHQSRGAGQYLDNGGWEYNMVRWLEREGYDVRYTTNIETHAHGVRLLTSKAFMSVGHDEYWSHEMRTNVVAARDRGVHLGFFSANTCYWQIRLEPGADGTPNRTIVSYKENVFKEDPLYLDKNAKNDHLLTTKWRRWPILNPEVKFIGVQYIYNPVDSDIVIEDPAHWVFAGTNLKKGDRLKGLLGYEVDRVYPGAPSNVHILAASPIHRNDSEPETSHMTIYQAESGALVFATGSIQWAWGLDDYNSPDGRTKRSSPAAQKITANVLNRMISEDRRQPGL